MSQDNTATTMHPLVGMVGELPVDDVLAVTVEVLDVRFGGWQHTQQFLVTPASGTGQRWVNGERVTNLRKPEGD